MDTERIHVVPAKGLRVLDPVNRQPLPPEGKEVERSTYWLRRERDGDVTIAATKTAKKAKE